MTLISRYILREAFASCLIVLGALFLITMTNELASIFGDAATDRLPRDAVGAVFGLTALTYLTTLLPIALFLGVMLALARLSRDGEMAALSACGFGPARLLVPVGALTLLLVLCTGWLSLVMTPAASRQIEEIRFRAGEHVELAAIEPGRFTSPDSGDTVLYPREVVGDELRDVFMERQQGDRVVAIVAARGQRVTDPATGELSFVLYDGRRYEGVPGQGKFLVVDFGEQRIPVRRKESKEFVAAAAGKTTLALLESALPADRAELQWRISLPLSLIVLGLLAVPLSRSSPREGRYGRLGIGLLIYIVYANMMSIASAWVQRGVVSEWVGMWWVHGVVAAFALLMLARESGWLTLRPAPRMRVAT
ncbi:MAG TPA: LPS export ABC transporter permease LptF [Gammaproteobacteria bacterium]|nr:LPS export ABC transporter permease LptF [Gammaproteobacteria bacterium]